MLLPEMPQPKVLNNKIKQVDKVADCNKNSNRKRVLGVHHKMNQIKDRQRPTRLKLLI